MKRFIGIFMTLCLVLGLSSVSAWAADSTSQEQPSVKAIVGETLVNPESGWKRAIGNDFVNCVNKTGTWTNNNSSNPRLSLSYNSSAGYDFKFVGDRIRFLKYYEDHYTSEALHVRVDGVDYHSQKFTTYAKEAPYLAIEISNLSKEEHSVEVLGTYASSSRHVSVYPVDIPTDGYIVEKTNLSVLLNEGETVQLSTSYDLENNKNFTWGSTNKAVALVDANGKVTAVAKGTADVYVQNQDGTFKEYIPVKVVKGVADKLRLAVHLKTAETANLYLTDDSSKVIWSSMDESIATVSAQGKVTGVKKGLAIIKGELEGKTYQIYVRVNG